MPLGKVIAAYQKIIAKFDNGSKWHWSEFVEWRRPMKHGNGVVTRQQCDVELFGTYQTTDALHIWRTGYPRPAVR